jgi:hypothetical protein
MPAWAIAVIVVAAVIVIGAVAAWAFMQRRSSRLRSTFSSEYDRTVADTGGRREAEKELLDREKKRRELDIVPLSTAARDRYLEQWRRTQAEFVDSPEAALRNANALVEDVMDERGYPVDDFEEQAAVISVDHAGVVENYRVAHEISLAAAKGEASTEEMRRGMRHYRSLFEDLLEEAVERGRSTQTETEARETEEARR